MSNQANAPNAIGSVVPPFGGAVGGGGPVAPASSVESAAGAWTVPMAAAVGDLVYVTGAFTADEADASSVATSPAIGVIIAKPTPVTATLSYFGETAVFGGLTVGADYFLDTVAGGITTTAPSTPGEVVQRVGVAINATTLLFDPEQPTVVL